MIEGKEELMNYLESLKKFDRFKALRKAVPLVRMDNEEGLLAGTDADGKPFPEPKASAAERGGDGPYLVPRGAESRAIANQEVRSTGNDIVVTWDDADFLKYYNVVGIRPAGMQRIIDAVVNNIKAQIGKK